MSTARLLYVAVGWSTEGSSDGVSTLPELLTVEEAARLIRVGRTKAYAMAREWRATNGRSGLPVVDFGNVLRVPRRALEELIGVELSGDNARSGDCDPGARARTTAHDQAPTASTASSTRASTQPDLFDRDAHDPVSTMPRNHLRPHDLLLTDGCTWPCGRSC